MKSAQMAGRVRLPNADYALAGIAMARMVEACRSPGCVARGGGLSVACLSAARVSSTWECVGAVGVIEAFVVLTQQVQPVVASVRGAHHSVDVMGRGGGVVERHAGVVIELDEHHRAVHTVVEGPSSPVAPIQAK